MRAILELAAIALPLITIAWVAFLYAVAPLLDVDRRNIRQWLRGQKIEERTSRFDVVVISGHGKSIVYRNVVVAGTAKMRRPILGLQRRPAFHLARDNAVTSAGHYPIYQQCL